MDRSATLPLSAWHLVLSLSCYLLVLSSENHVHEGYKSGNDWEGPQDFVAHKYLSALMMQPSYTVLSHMLVILHLGLKSNVQKFQKFGLGESSENGCGL